MSLPVVPNLPLPRPPALAVAARRAVAPWRRRRSPRPRSSRRRPPLDPHRSRRALAHREWLEKHFDFHPLDFEDVYSRNQRPKLDSYDDYIFIVLHFPIFEKATGRLLSAELDLFIGPDYLITLPNIPLPPLSAMFERLREKRRPPRGRPSRRARATCSTRSSTPTSTPRSRCSARWAIKLDRLEDDIFEGRSSRDRPRHLEREAGDHQLPQDRPAPARRPARPRADQAALPRRKSSRSTSTTSPTPPSGSGTRSRTTRRSSRRSSRRTSRVLSHRLNDSFRILTAASVSSCRSRSSPASSG